MIIENDFDVIEVQWVAMMLLLLLDGGHPAVITTFTFPLYQEGYSKGIDLPLPHYCEKGPYIAKWTNQSYTM